MLSGSRISFGRVSWRKAVTNRTTLADSSIRGQFRALSVRWLARSTCLDVHVGTNCCARRSDITDVRWRYGQPKPRGCILRPQKRIKSKNAVYWIRHNRTEFAEKPASPECLGGFSMRRITQNLRLPTPEA